MADTIENPQNEVKESPIVNGKLYGLWNITSRKTVRAKEKHYVSFFKRNKELKGNLVKTGRGYFIDGYNVDMKAVYDWAAANESNPGAGDGLTPFKPKRCK